MAITSLKSVAQRLGKEVLATHRPMLLALYGHPDSGGIWKQHLNGHVVKPGWKQILPDMWPSIFHHQELNCLLVVYVDNFRMAGPTENMEKAWASIRAAVNIGNPEPYDRYLGCMHREFESIRLPKEAHPFAFAFEAKTSAAAQHRTQDWWGHDEDNKAWIRHHVQPRKRLYQPGGEGERVAVKIQVFLLSLTKGSH